MVFLCVLNTTLDIDLSGHGLRFPAPSSLAIRPALHQRGVPTEQTPGAVFYDCLN